MFQFQLALELAALRMVFKKVFDQSNANILTETFENPPEWLNFSSPKFQKIDDVIGYS